MKQAKHSVKTAFKEARRALIVEKKLHGYSTDMLCKEFNISEARVREELIAAQKSNLLQTIEQRILDKLSTKALDLYDKALADNDLFVAKDVLTIANKIADRDSKKQVQREGMNLQLWMQMRRERLKDDPSSESGGDVIEAVATSVATDDDETE
jgi:hypothetical protein